MNKASQYSEWIDIIPLTIPYSSVGISTFQALFIMAIVFFSLFHLWRNRSKRLARKKINSMLKELLDEQSSIDTKTLTHNLKACLTQYFKCNDLYPITKHKPYKIEWYDFCKKLKQYQFQNSAPSKEELHSLLKQSLTWIIRIKPTHA